MFFKNRMSITSGLALLAMIAGTFIHSTASAQQAKVVKVQGKKAIVQFPDDARPRVGQIIELGGADGVVSMGGSSSGSTGGRNMIIGGSAELSSLTPSGASSSGTTLSLDARYGWNKSEMEYGAIGRVDYYSTTAISRRALEVGGFFDYNLVPNVAGTEMIYGGAATAKFGSLASSAGGVEITGTLMTLEVGGQLKWFPLGHAVAIRGDLLYRIESVSDTVKGMAGGSGLVAKGGLYVYF